MGNKYYFIVIWNQIGKPQILEQIENLHHTRLTQWDIGSCSLYAKAGKSQNFNNRYGWML